MKINILPFFLSHRRVFLDCAKVAQFSRKYESFRPSLSVGIRDNSEEKAENEEIDEEKIAENLSFSPNDPK